MIAGFIFAVLGLWCVTHSASLGYWDVPGLLCAAAGGWCITGLAGQWLERRRSR